MVRVAGIGRNEYIDTLNKCKAKKLLWRVSRAIAREHLPAEPLRLAKGDWWVAHVVNIGARRGGRPGAERARMRAAPCIPSPCLVCRPRAAAAPRSARRPRGRLLGRCMGGARARGLQPGAVDAAGRSRV